MRETWTWWLAEGEKQEEKRNWKIPEKESRMVTKTNMLKDVKEEIQYSVTVALWCTQYRAQFFLPFLPSLKWKRKKDLEIEKQGVIYKGFIVAKDEEHRW